MNKIIIAFLFFSHASLTVDFHKESSLPANQLAKMYVDLSLQESSSAEGIPLEGSRHVSPEEITKSFFAIEHDKIQSYPLESQKLFTFLDKNGFLVKRGMINVKGLDDAKTGEKRLFKTQIKKFLKQPLHTVPDDWFINYIVKSGYDHSVFDQKKLGFFLRNINHASQGKLAEKAREQILFQPNHEISALYERLKEKNSEVLSRLRHLGKILDQSSTKKDFFAKLETPDHEQLNINIGNLVEQFPYVDERFERGLKSNIEHGISNIKEVNEAIDLAYPSPIDALLLYSFYHFDESQILFYKIENKKSIISFFNDEEYLSSTNILRPLAYETLEKLGYDKKSKKKKKPKKKKKSNEPLMLEDLSLNEKEPKIEEDLFEDSDQNRDNDEKESPESSATGITLNIAAKEHRILDALARLLSGHLNLIGECAGSVSVALINDAGRDKLAIALKHTKVEVEPIIEALNKISSIDTALPHDTHQAIKRSKDVIKEISREMVSKAADGYLIKLRNDRLKERKNIDKIKLRDFLTKPAKGGLQNRLHKLLNSKLDKSNVILVNNALNYHSEIALAEYLLDAGFILEKIAQRKDLLGYQYIGNSMKTCVQCAAIFNGAAGIKGYNENSALKIFFRDSFDNNYPNYMIPLRATTKNGCSREDLRFRLSRLGNSVIGFNKNLLILRQAHELSDDSDEEHK